MHSDVVRSFSALVGNGFLSRVKETYRRQLSILSPPPFEMHSSPLKEKRKKSLFRDVRSQRAREREREGEEVLAPSRSYRSLLDAQSRCTRTRWDEFEKIVDFVPIGSRLVGPHSFILSASRISDNARLACIRVPRSLHAQRIVQLLACAQQLRRPTAWAFDVTTKTSGRFIVGPLSRRARYR